jgi:hypothetical protein
MMARRMKKNGGTVLTAEVRFLLLAVGLEAHRLVEILQDGALVVLIGQNLVVFDVDLVFGVVDQFGVDKVLFDVGNVRVQRGGGFLGGVARDQVLFFLLFGGFWRFFCVLARRGLAEIIQTCGDGLGLDPVIVIAGWVGDAVIDHIFDHLLVSDELRAAEPPVGLHAGQDQLVPGQDRRGAIPAALQGQLV